MPIIGVLELIDADVAHGWAVDPENPSQPVSIEILDGTDILASGYASNQRSDLNSVGDGSGRHAFSIDLPPSRTEANRLLARVAGTEHYLPALSDLLAQKHPAKQSGYQGVHELMTTEWAKGWVVSLASPLDRASVEVFLDNRVLATGVANLHRPDLIEAGIGDGSHAFEISVPTGVLAPDDVSRVRVRVLGVNESLPLLSSFVTPDNSEESGISTPSVSQEDIDFIERSGFFDADFYKSKYLNSDASPVNPVMHYLQSGWAALHNPSEQFDTQFYLERYPDVKRVGANPLLHFLRFGRAEGRHPNASYGQYCLIVHAFHLDTLPDLAAAARYLPEQTDTYVTFPAYFDLDQRSLIQTCFPTAVLVPVENIGQDVGALTQLFDAVDLTRYGFVCKIHTKKGQKHPTEWRRILLRGVLGGTEQVQRTIATFRNNPSVVLAGARQLYLNGIDNLYKNERSILEDFGNLLGGIEPSSSEWGFFGGTFFWARTSIISAVCKRAKQIGLRPMVYTDDGTLAHAAERMFGLLANLNGGAVLLNDAVKTESPGAIVQGFPRSLRRGTFTASKWLSTKEITSSVRDTSGVAQIAVQNSRAMSARSSTAPSSLRGTVVGDLNLRGDSPIVFGWLAIKGDGSTRTALLRFGDAEMRVEANTFRVDLKQNGINDGRHAFSVIVPAAVMDGKERNVILVDLETGTEIVSKRGAWRRPKRSYTDFKKFLCASMTNPVVEAPFVEEDKRCFAVMEGIANHLAATATKLETRPLVSVVMPVYNRVGLVEAAIESVLAQTYREFELIIVDDGSFDETVSVVRAFVDPRIKLVVLEQNVGHSAARNEGLSRSSGDIITYLDSDNTWDERYLAAVVGAFSILPSADAVYSGQLLFRGSAKQPFAIRYGHLNVALLQNQNFIDLNCFAHRSGHAAAWFDASLKRYVDYDMIMRFVEQSVVYSVPVLLSNYFLDKTDNTVTNDSRHTGDLTVVRDRMRSRTEAKLFALHANDLDRPVSIVIPNWQGLEDIKDCLGAIASKDWKDKLSIIVVDNASDGEVVKFLKKLDDEKAITLICNEKNYGFTYAVNQGIRVSDPKSDVLLLNNDAILQPGAVFELQRACYNLPGAGMTVPRQILPTGTPSVSTHVPFANLSCDCDVNISAHHDNIADLPLFRGESHVQLTYAPFFAVYLRRDLIEAVGELDAEYGRHYRSDRVYCDMVQHIANRKIYYAPDAHVIHKLQKATDQLRSSKNLTTEFDLMFKRNAWDVETAMELGYRFAPWDTF